MVLFGDTCFALVYLLIVTQLAKAGMHRIPSRLEDNLPPRIHRGGLIETIVTTLSVLDPVNLRLLYDEKFQDIAEALVRREGYESGVMVTQSRENVTFKHLLVPAGGRTVLLTLCSTSTIVGMFRKIQKEKLESHFVLWLLVLENEGNLDEVTTGLKGRVEEGTQVLLLLRVSDTSSKFFASRLNADGIVRFLDLGSWNIQDNRSREVLTGLLTPDPLENYSNFKGRELTLAVNNNLPLSLLGRKTPDGKEIPPSGMDFSIVNTLKEDMNFTYRIVRPADGKWGGPLPNGTVTGLVGLVYRKEATFAMSGVTIIGPRESVVDLTYPYYQDSLCLVSKAPQQKNRAFAAFSPFTLQVWMSIIIATLSIGPVVKIQSELSDKCRKNIARKTSKDAKSLEMYSFNMFRNMVLQGNMINTNRWPLRFIFIFWYLFCIIVAALYSGTLTAVLAIPSYEKPIDSLTDLPRAIQEGYTVGTVKETMIEYLLRGATEGIYKQTWDLLNHKDPSKSLLENPVIGFSKILGDNFIFIAPTAVSGIATASRGRDKFHIGRQTFYPLSYGIAVATGSPLRDKFSLMLSKLVEGGLIFKYRDDEFLKFLKKSSSGEGDSKTPPAISLIQLQAAFFLFALGCGIAIISLLLENVYSKFIGHGRMPCCDHFSCCLS